MYVHKLKSIFAASVIALAFLLLPAFFYVNAQDVGQSVLDHRAELERNLAALEQEINQQRSILDTKQKERQSLEGDVAILNAKIQKAKLSIKARDLVIQGLGEDIKQKEGTIGKYTKKIDSEKESLAQLLRKTNEIDSYSMVELVLANKDISDFFIDLDSFGSIQAGIQDSFQLIESSRKKTEAEKSTLESKVAEQVELRKLQQLEAERVKQQEAEKKKIIAQSKGTEANYQKIIKDKEKNAAAIRSELFTLQGSTAIPFEKALEYATAASRKTGVRPAVILGIIAEESNLGENVGTGSWRVDMKAPRDTVPFLDITSRLGLDPEKMPVSKKAWYGYGGAMGPAQFIPSTWIIYEGRIAEAGGHTPPNPWDPRDAFMATGLLMADNGASAGTRAAERLAALRYLAGWTNATKKAYAFYGDDVMDLADKYQKLIDILGS